MKIGITLGDPAGIGPEIILKTVPSIKKVRNIEIFGNKKILRRTAHDLGLLKNYRSLESLITECTTEISFSYGQPNQKTGRAALRSIDTALKSKCDIIITPPIVKSVIKCFVPDFIGHTEYFADFFGVDDYAMVGLWRSIRIMLLTTHLPLGKVLSKINARAVVRRLLLWNRGLKKYFGVKKPKIGVSALNPHAYEFSLGEEEKIKKGIKIAQQRGIDCHGPYPADSLFSKKFDGFLTMFHDQAMIYLKAKKNGLNFTLGLPVIRLSPLYGAALDIAGKNQAEISGFITAIMTGIRFFKNARRYDELENKK